MIRTIFILCAILVMCTTSCKAQKDQITPLKTFAKAYGYVKYFHPSDEASQIDWKNFASYGANEILKCSSQTEVIDKLNALFKPIAPGVVFSNKKSKYELKAITPPNKEEYVPTYWQHKGVSIDMNYSYDVYQSVRVNVFSEINKDGETQIVKEESIFDAAPKFGEIIEKEIGDNIFFQAPLTLYGNDEGTYPKSKDLESLKKGLNMVNMRPNNLPMKLGNIINTYNVFQHFYPYFEEVGVDWDKELEVALKRSFNDKTDLDHLITLQKFTSPLKDGHIQVKGANRGMYQLPINWEFIESELIITDVFNDSLGINIGDIVTKINDQSIEDYFSEINSTISAGTDGFLRYLTQRVSLFGEVDTELTISVNNRDIILKRDSSYTYRITEIPIQKNTYKILDQDIYYLNLSKISMDTITMLLPKLQESNGIICDLRGYPNGNHDLISHLLEERDTSKSWMRIPEIIYPDQEKITGFETHSWDLEPKRPYLGDKKVVFIIDGRAISYAESYMSFIEGYDLATIVGQPTAGTNGNVNSFNLLGGYAISWTGMKVLKHDGSQHHGIGIKPDVLVNRTIEGVKAGRDEFLEVALNIILE